MAGGRPTIYSNDILQKTKDYLLNFAELGDQFPMIEGLACELKISKDTIYEWEKQPDKQEFSDVICELRNKQARVCLNKGVTGEFQPKITTLLLNKHGYTDKQQIDVESPNGTMSPKEMDDKELARRVGFMIQGLLNK